MNLPVLQSEPSFWPTPPSRDRIHPTGPLNGRIVVASVTVGTSGWSYRDWAPTFYPAGAAPGVYLAYYADRFNMVEVDSTYYRIPSPSVVRGWHEKTPDHFRFTVKVPGLITHEKVLLDCERDRDAFLEALTPLGDKLHSILLQFGYFNKKTFPEPGTFFERLDHFLRELPRPRQVAVEIRNKNWLTDEFFQLLRRHGSAYVLTEHSWMPPVERVMERHDCLTGDFVYLRLIGDRAGIEKITTNWDKIVIDRTERFAQIASALAHNLSQADIVTFINNHFAGHGPASCEAFLRAMADAKRETLH